MQPMLRLLPVLTRNARNQKPMSLDWAGPTFDAFIASLVET